MKFEFVDEILACYYPINIFQLELFDTRCHAGFGSEISDMNIPNVSGSGRVKRQHKIILTANYQENFLKVLQTAFTAISAFFFG